jgi:bifunctional oligoribonuclease and PAP phosphatase NrnA
MMNIQDVPENLIKFLNDYTNYYIISHSDPDGDCIMSSLALGHYLSRKGKQCILVSPGPFGRMEVLDYQEKFTDGINQKDLKHDSAAIVLDCSTRDRIGTVGKSLGNLPVAIIDHHATGNDFGDIRYVEKESPSTTFLIQKIIETIGDTPQKIEAHYLLFGLCTDTGFFRFIEKGSGAVFSAVGRLVDKGVSPRSIYNKIFGGHSFGSRKLLAMLLERTEAYFGNKVLLTWQTKAEVGQYSNGNRDSDSLYQLLLSIRSCQAVVFIKEENSKSCSVSFRSTDDIDVGAVAKSFGGGGHKNASGCTIKDDLFDVKNSIHQAFTDIFM